MSKSIDPTGHEVNFDSYFDAPDNDSALDTFSELMFTIKWFNQIKFNELMTNPDYAKFMRLEESELTPELEEELAQKLDQLGRHAVEVSGKPSIDELNQYIESVENDPDNLEADV